MAPACHSQSTARFQCDLSATLYHSRWTLRQRMDSHTLLYSPDSPGMPVLLDDNTVRLYDRFAGGTRAGSVVSSVQAASGRSFPELLTIVNELVDRGFLREQPDAEVFSPKPYKPALKSMNLWVHINNYCNLACSYCFVEHSRTWMQEEVIEATVARVGKTVRAYGAKDILVKFAGGEPTMTLPQVESFYTHLTRELEDTGAYVHWTVLTNGTNLSKRFLQFVERAKATISISVDGYGKYHDLYRVYRMPGRSRSGAELNVLNGTGGHQRGSWETINRNIEKLRSLGISPYINAMAGPRTSPGLPELAEWIFSKGMIGTFHVVRNVEDSWEAGAHRRDQYRTYCDQLQRDFDRMFTLLEQERFRINLPRWMEIAELYFDSPAPDICCGIGSDHVVIKHDGTLASCPMTVHEQTIVPADDLFAAARATFSTSPENRGADECLSCQWFKVCASGCPVANQRIRGHPFTQSPLCSFWKYVIPRYVQFYGTKLLQAKEKKTGCVWNGCAPRN